MLEDKLKSVVYSPQQDEYSCGIHCTHVILNYLGITIDYPSVKSELDWGDDGTDEEDIINFLKSSNLKVTLRKTFTKSWLKSYLGSNKKRIMLLSRDDYSHWVAPFHWDGEYFWVFDSSEPRSNFKLTEKTFFKVMDLDYLILVKNRPKKRIRKKAKKRRIL